MKSRREVARANGNGAEVRDSRASSPRGLDDDADYDDDYYYYCRLLLLLLLLAQPATGLTFIICFIYGYTALSLSLAPSRIYI